MKVSLTHLASLSVILMVMANNVRSWILPFDVCAATPTITSIEKIREDFSAIRLSIQMKDTRINLRILEEVCMTEIPQSDRCCFLHYILHFYMNKVFNNYVPQDLKHRKRFSDISNSFWEFYSELQPCGFIQRSRLFSEEGKLVKTHSSTPKIGATVEAKQWKNYKGLRVILRSYPLNSAVIKAFGELDILLDWIENLY